MLEVAPYLPMVHGASQVVLNLVLNAVDASPKGGTIEVSVIRAKDENFVEIRVKDHGPGIPTPALDLRSLLHHQAEGERRGTGAIDL